MEYGIDSSQNIHIGDELEIDGEKIKIVGSVFSTDFLIKNSMLSSRGSSNLGSGKISFCLFATHDYFDFDYYTAVYIIDEKLIDQNVNSDEYKQIIKKDKEKLNEVKGKLEEEKYNKIVSEANSKIDEEEKKANIELEEAKNKLDNAKLELDNGKEKLDNTKPILKSKKKELESAKKQIDEYSKKLNSAKIELDAGKEKLDETKQTLDSSKKELDDAEDKINKYEQELINAKIELDNNKEKVNEELSKFDFDYDRALALINGYGSKEAAIEGLRGIAVAFGLDDETVENLIEVINAIVEIEDGYSKYNEGKIEIENQKANLDSAKEEYSKGLEEYNLGLNIYKSSFSEYTNSLNELKNQKNKYETAKKEYNDGLNKYNLGIEEYDTSLNEYNSGIEEYNKGKQEAEEKIKSARKEVENIEKAAFYITDRNDNYEYSTYMSLCKSFDNLSKTFPVIFFVVAVFVSLLSMARMAIENRAEIGTLKALGFSNKEIRVKFIIYSLFATLLGGVLGAIVGDYYLSYLCYLIFSDIYQIPIFVNTLNIYASIVGNLFSTLAIVGATLYVTNRLLKADATSLLRPIAPPIGKKIFLEKIKPFWNRLSFNNKIMARNIFRYKRRVIMSLLGFIGCTSLLMAGYAIKDSMLNIIDKQYIEISDYDQIVNLDEKLSEDELNKIFDYKKINKLVYVKTSLVEFQDHRATFIVPNDTNNFKTIFNLKDYKTGKELELKDNKIIITVNLAKELHKKVGDELEFVDSNNVMQKFKISGIAENYVDNFIYINKKTYTDNVDKFSINCAFLKFDSLENTESIMKNLNKNEHVLTTLSVDYLINTFKSMLGAFDNIIILMIIFSGLLSFVVMYSLAYITISERQKEIATLKVLGYSEKRVDGYILKEQLNILIIGIIVGIITGSIYSNILVKNINFNQLYLVKQIETASYFKTAGFIVLFALIISIGVHYMLKKVKMVESLKSIE